jgi:DNA-binding beta-propeller fold protein YncE
VFAWVTSQGDGTVTPIDVATNTPGTPIVVGDGSSVPYRIAAAPDGSAVYVTMFGDNSVRRIDTATGTVGPPILVGVDRTSNPIGIAITPDGSTAYVSDYSYTGDGVVTPIDLATGIPGAPIEPHAELDALAISPDGRTAWVLEQTFPDAIVPINLKTRAVGKPISLGGQYPQSIAITPDGSTAYAVDFHTADTVTPVDLTTRTAGEPITVGAQSEGIAINPQGTLAYVTNSGIDPVDLATGTVGPTIAPAAAPLVTVEFTPDGSAAYATLFRTRTGRAVVVDVAKAKQRHSVVVGTKATDVAITPDQPPNAAFRAHRAPAGSATQFDASGSDAVSSPIATYHWDYGDGTSAELSGPIAVHTYTAPGTYDVVLTLTDEAGTSTQRVYTGQNMSRNGSRVARRAHAVTIS